MKKRLLSTFLSLALVLCFAPTASFANSRTDTDKSIMLGTSGISAYDSTTKKADTIYYGVYTSGTKSYNVPWYAVCNLSTTEQGDSTNWNGGMLCKNTLWNSSFGGSGHYPESSIKSAMDKLYGGEKNIFTSLELGKINQTTLKGNSMHSSVSDFTAHLFALSSAECDSFDKSIENATAIDTSNNSGYWLRTSTDVGQASRWYPGWVQTACDHSTSTGVRPAFNLDINSVFLTSTSGTSKSSAIASGSTQVGTTTSTEWKLTLKDSGKTISLTENEVASIDANGTITIPYTYVDTATTDTEKVNQISVMITDKVYTESDAQILYYGALQGNLSASDASGTGTFALPNALQGQKFSTDYHIYILAEHTTTTNATDYASAPVEISSLSITGIAVTGIDTPASTQALDTSASCTSIGVATSTPAITWEPSAVTAGYSTIYTAKVTLSPLTGYSFTENVAATVNGNTATSATRDTDGNLVVTYTFAATLDKLSSITAPDAITVASGTAYADMNLPTQVSIVTEGNTVTTAAVTWNTQTPATGSYDPSKLEEQSITLNGTVTCPETVDAGTVPLTTTIAITISRAAAVEAPTYTPTAGTYESNQTVALASATNGATIYYTTDGSDPSLDENGELSGTTKIYSDPITVTGTQGQSVKTTIKAFAAKAGMFNSSVSGFVYTINLPQTQRYGGSSSGGGAGGGGAVVPSTDTGKDTGSDNIVNKSEDKKTDTAASTTANIKETTKTTTSTAADGSKTTKTTANVDTTTASKIVEKAVENKSKEVVIDAQTTTTSTGSTGASGTTGNTGASGTPGAAAGSTEATGTDAAGADKAPTTVAAAGTTTEVTIPTATIAQLSEKTSADIVIKTDNASITLDEKTVAAITEQIKEESKASETGEQPSGTADQGKTDAGTSAGGTAAAETLKLTVTTVEQSDSSVKFDVKIETASGEIKSFNGGKVTLTVSLNSKLASQKNLVCVYINDQGIYSRILGKKGANGTYTFTTKHFSTYAIMTEEEVDKIIAEQTADAKKLASKIKLSASSKKTSKGSIKVTLKTSKGASSLKSLEELGYTVKYKFYRSTKKSSSYKAMATKTSKTYTNTSGKKGTRYYYKARVMVYNSEGTLVASTALKQCKYATRIK